MASLFNQYSFLIFAVVGGILLAAMLWRWALFYAVIRGVLFAVYVVGVIGFMLSSRYPTEVSAMSVDEVQATLNNGQPTLVMLYSNYCIGCMRELPAVRGLIPQLENANVNVLLLNIHDSPGRDLLDDFDFRVSPTYLIFDADGEEVSRLNRIPSMQGILEAAQ